MAMRASGALAAEPRGGANAADREEDERGNRVDRRRADRACSVLTLVGAINIPIIYFSVQWWNTLHQGATISMTAAPKMAAIMLTAAIKYQKGASHSARPGYSFVW